MPSALTKIRHSWTRVKSPSTPTTKESRVSSDSSSSTAPALASSATTQMLAPATTAPSNPLQQADEVQHQPLRGRVFAVTGGASGIGLATAKMLARRGAVVCVADVDPEALKTAAAWFQESHQQCDFERVDVSKRAQVDAWIAGVVARHGRLDGAANVAGVIGRCHGVATVAELEDEDWDSIIGVNLTGTMYCMRAQLRSVERGGSIVNVSSIHGLKGFARHAAYDASKHGIVGLTRAAALENGDREVRVNSVAPGAVYTPLMQKNWECSGRPADAPFDEPTAFRRQGTAEETASVICFLLGPESSFCNGDGSNPCEACLDRDADCVYLVPSRVSKADLRDEVARLQSASCDNEAILDTIASKDTSPAQLDNILRRLSGGQPRAQVASLVSNWPVAPSRLGTGFASLVPADSSWETPSSLAAATPPSDALPTELVSSQSSTSPPGLSGRGPSPNLAPPQDPAKATEFRANLGHCRSQLPQLLSTILARDCLLFCPISEPDLKRDFARDSATHCSAALVDSLLALGTLAAKDHAHLATALAAPGTAIDPDSLAQAFAHEAMFALDNGTGRPRRTADIQALGVLSLYYVSCYRLKQATEFAGDFYVAIAELWRADRSSETHASSRLDKIEHAGLYCAAVSLTRVLFLILDYHKTLDAYARSVGITPIQAVQDPEMPAVPWQVGVSDTPIIH
ncbi:short chain dehydrogenase family protein [Cordyceps fumosorosea ARSEF 2679]|uniref:Short chain dehydrogenase family protein n=1 Tax=Cordyceps fumosorosea (strain ARSEF 2679) TaxID=1081104 RepID=A0A167IMB0_CORFA|nr:short chain dehydrogenase family protein [Cordyceps fumosorosea ARSEF 2679]OAA49225.1 short chain dehydrogenase family protein [Cordyceps fumosorosea ARSEF 2679]